MGLVSLTDVLDTMPRNVTKMRYVKVKNPVILDDGSSVYWKLMEIIDDDNHWRLVEIIDDDDGNKVSSSRKYEMKDKLVNKFQDEDQIIPCLSFFEFFAKFFSKLTHTCMF